MKTITTTIRQYFLILTLMCVGVMTAQAATYTVTNADDSGAGSLREAINQANASIDNDTIIFAPGANGTITLTSALPALANNGSLTITGNGSANTIISGNNAVRPLTINGGANVTLSGLTITQGNSLDSGGGGTGGGAINFGTLTIINSTFSDNITGGGGGGGIASFGILTITGSTLSGNTAGRGGAIYLQDATATLTNTTISGNTATYGAAAISNLSGGGRSGSLTLNSCTVTGNTGVTTGGVSAFDNGNSSANVTTTLKNTIVANNSNPQLSRSGANAHLVSQGYNLTSDNGSGLLTGIGDQINTDPLLAPLADNGGTTFTHALLMGSPAIDAGNSTLPTDQRGLNRPFDSPLYPNAANGSDIGAFEYQGSAPTNKDQCKNGGWMTFDSPRTFKNQGDCIQFVNTGK